MGVFTHETKTVSSVAPARLFKAIVGTDNLISKIASQTIKSTEILEGNGGPGTVKKTTFGVEGNGKYSKQRVDVLDTDTFTYSYTIFESDLFPNFVEKITNEIKMIASDNGEGCVVKSVSRFYSKDEHDITEEQVKEALSKASLLFKATEAYLIANPDACN